MSYFDANGVKLGQTALPDYGQFAYKKTDFVAPEGKLIAYMEVTTPKAADIFIDALQWGDR